MTTLGTIGSGLDVESIVKALVDADVAPKTNSLTRKEASLNAELSAIGSLKSVMSGLKTSLDGLKDGSIFDARSVSSPSSVEVTQTGAPAVGNYSIDVSALATSQVLASAGFDTASTAIGTGTLTISVGKPTYVGDATSGAYGSFTPATGKTATITIDSSNNTVSGIRDAVNAAKIGVTASLVVDGSTTRLIFTADDTGAETAISIAVTDTGDSNNTDASGLSRLAYSYDSGSSPNFSGNLTEARSSQDASFALNGLALTYSANKIPNLIDGLDVTLKSTTTSAETLTISSDVAVIEASVTAFVDAYNTYQAKLSALMDFENAEGALAGDSTARRIQSVLRATTTGILALDGNAFSAISDIGITSDQKGVLTINSSDFQAALSTNPTDLKQFFAGNNIATGLSDNTDSAGLADKLTEAIDTYVSATVGMLTSKEQRLTSAIKDVADDRLDIVARMDSLEERYTKQFTAMNNLVGQLQGTSDFLTNQMDALKAAANR